MKRAHESEKNFKTCYKEINNWLKENYPQSNHETILKEYFPDFVTDDALDFQKMKEGLLKNYGRRTVKGLNKSTELLKIAFHHGYQTECNVIHTQDLDELIKNYGNQIVAHGVEEMKGGMYNLLSMCITNKVAVQSMYWGPIIEGAPDISALPHGPYYIIYSTPLHPQKNPHYPTMDAIPYILVPFAENKVILEAKLYELVSLDVITQETKGKFLGKLRTYAELNAELKAGKKQDNVLLNTPKKNLANTFFMEPERTSSRIKDVEESGLLTARQKLKF